MRAEPGRRPPASGWRWALAVLVAAAAWAYLAHPAPAVPWFDFGSVIYGVEPFPLTPAGLADAVRWQSVDYYPMRTRPVRSVAWFLAAKAFACDAFGLHLANVVSFALATLAAAWLGAEAGGDRRRGALVGAAFAVSYASVFGLLMFGYAVAAAPAFAGLAAYFRAERSAGAARRGWHAAAVLLLLGAVLSHEVYLAFAVVPLLHAVLVRRERGAVLPSLPMLGLVPLYAALRALEMLAWGKRQAVLGAAAPSLENTLRLLFEVASGGLVLDPLRALPWIDEYLRIREWLVTPAGLATAALAAAPGVALSALGWRALGRSPAGARTRLFLAAWLLACTAPLMLPVSAVEAYHLTGALGALVLLWAGALFPPAPTGRRALALAWVALALWGGVHLGARFLLVQRDVPAMGAAAAALQRVIARAEADGVRAAVLFAPIQIGGHWGTLPTLLPLYPAPGGCRRAERQAGCLLDGVWVWSGLGRRPTLPGACVAPEGVRVGPLTAESERLAAGTRKMLEHWGATRGAVDTRALGACALSPPETVALGGRRYALYAGAGEPGTRWYRFVFDPAPRLVPLEPCPPVSPLSEAEIAAWLAAEIAARQETVVACPLSVAFRHADAKRHPTRGVH